MAKYDREELELLYTGLRVTHNSARANALYTDNETTRKREFEHSFKINDLRLKIAKDMLAMDKEKNQDEKTIK